MVPLQKPDDFCHRAFFDLTLVVLQRELQLLYRSVACGERIGAMTTEVVTRVLQVSLGALERCDGFPYLRMGLAPGAWCRSFRGSCLCDGHDLRRWGR